MRSPTLTPVPSNSPTISIPPRLEKYGVFIKNPMNTPAFVSEDVSDITFPSSPKTAGSVSASTGARPPVPKPK